MGASRSLGVAWVYDADEHRRQNRARRSYWHAYAREILSRLGVTAEAISPVEAVEPATLADVAALIVGPAGADLSAAAAPLHDFADQGGVVIGFAPLGLDELFGVEGGPWPAPPADPYNITAYVRLVDHPLTEGIHSPYHPDQPLIVLSPVREIAPVGSALVAEVLRPSPSEPGRGTAATPTGQAAVTARRIGDGWAIHFAFDPAQTMWLLHQGRPIDRDYDGDGYLRSMDARLIADNEPEVGYSDELHFLLQRMIGLRPVPMVHQLPPVDGRVPDALFFFGGDDEGGKEHHQVIASDYMRSQGMPYHINIMRTRGQFALTADEIAHIEANGHELSLHYNYIDDFEPGSGFTRQDVLEQAALFRREFGRAPVCTVNHWARWVGGTEPVRWMLETGQRGDNGWIGLKSPPLNPTNRIDFSFGTAFPRRPYDDALHDNQPLEFIVEHVSAYEVGYQGEEVDLAMLHRAVDLAVRYHLTFNLFYHPIYIATCPGCRRAIAELRRMLDSGELSAALMGNDALVEWWQARSLASITDAEERPDGSLTMAVHSPPGDGIIVKLCLGDRAPHRVEADGNAVDFTLRHEFGANWLFVPLAPGRCARVAVFTDQVG